MRLRQIVQSHLIRELKRLQLGLGLPLRQGLRLYHYQREQLLLQHQYGLLLLQVLQLFL